jgi:hypothetical protein
MPMDGEPVLTSGFVASKRSTFFKVIRMSEATYLPDEPIPMARTAKEAVDRAVKALIHPDDQVRRAMVQHFMKWSIPIVREQLLDRLIKLLSAADESVRTRAAASLIDAGAYAVSWLTYRLGKSRKPDVQIRLADVVARAGRQVDPLHAMVFRPALELARRKTRHEGVRAAVTRAMEEMGAAYGVPGQTGAEGGTSVDATRPQTAAASDRPAPAAVEGRTDAM